ncbi:lipopolysaccharide biosynthesis protein [Pseudomonas nitroreducens]|uniref:lipopolysaccharide biosynthesis protein n=1 Tax=Pseudomonas nitroreducens TaxID=46680 RepID=UPI001FB6C3C6|nr:oligosaccharide flippase family protein [Pseudomonas nitroreducens]MCJ1879734.1 oligosaccharide flippase family protein [Pseudomonas nitroreducens]MCJ1896895.1 oligosaccharide flippase family protein [Pseudomonas nitroreducens]
MPKIPLSRIGNLALRSATLASKFLLIFFLARLLTANELGLYGLLTATIAYALYLVGLDFYTYTTREISKSSERGFGGMLKSQITMTVILYAIFLPLLLFIFSEKLLPWKLAIWFFALLILEHVNQELGRLLIALSQQHAASLNLFIRSGSWPLAVILLMTFYPSFKNLDSVLLLWVIGDLLAIALSTVKLRQLEIHGWREKVDWHWIIKGIKVALPFLVATLAIRGVFTFDRYWIQALANLEILGAYVLFMGMSSALLSFLDAGVFSFIYPELIRSYNEGDSVRFRAQSRNLLIQTILFSSAMALAAAVLLNPALSLIGKPFYSENSDLFYWSLSSILLYAFSMIPHYCLYAQGKDRAIILSHIIGCPVFLLSTWVLSSIFSYMAVSISLCIAFLIILIIKTLSFYLLTPRDYNPFIYFIK